MKGLSMLALSSGDQTSVAQRGASPRPDVDESGVVEIRKKPGTLRAGPFAVTASRC
jgi:hypothetical protein